ncbi:PREDICTED: MATE efflux family protein FRD3-like [Populus euphratica]|uniref:Protein DETOXIFICATION n=1 Tax=Populus euphratica TaxID=75702 RepID=A0AAJ6XNR5_POPEU|nr:PREDICTED: MATE efflux family protein FRD3-like [Populus euphratica]XP_011025439.1 PREDICTED: MATE efflux family protein FRD3-like [Populus euphratica]
MSEEGALQPVGLRKPKIPLSVFFRDARRVFKKDELGSEIIRIALPAAMALAADPVASLIDTAFIGRLGPVEIAAVGVAIAIFNQASKVTIFPLVSITTSFVAEEETLQRNCIVEAEKARDLNKDAESGKAKELPGDEMLENLEKGSATNNEKNIEKKDSVPGDDCKATTSKTTTLTDTNSVEPKRNKERLHIPSASTALIVGGILGLVQAIFLIVGAKPVLHIMGVKSDSAMLTPARKYLTLRALGSPAVLLSLAMQGVFRGFKDTRTPLYATVIGDLTNIVLDPIFIFVFNWGVSGAAIAHVLSQYLISLILLWRLMKKVNLLPPSVQDLQFSRFLKNGFLLLARVVAATICVTLAASRAARLGSTTMAAFQICLQVWLTSSLLADGLAVAGQAIIACAFAEKDYQKATTAATRVLQMSFILGLGLAVFVGLGLHFGDVIFSKDPDVLHIIAIGIPFVAATQPINSIAFVFDGVNFGASDFAYSSYSMVLVAIASIPAIFVLSKTGGFVGIWIALTIFMGLRTFAGVWRMGTGTGPWRFLRGRLLT